MKKIIKSRIFAFILGATLFTGITGVAAYNLVANEIGYNSTTVADALDGMYRINSFQTNYSEDEKVVGTWIDGKPIYQKTIIDTLGSDSIRFIDLNIPIKRVIDYNAMMFSGIGDQTYQSVDINIQGTSVDANKFIKVNIISDGNTSNNGKSAIRITRGSDLTWDANLEMVVTIQYTKTTD